MSYVRVKQLGRRARPGRLRLADRMSYDRVPAWANGGGGIRYVGIRNLANPEGKCSALISQLLIKSIPLLYDYSE
jgi:hypothetical protein